MKKALAITAVAVAAWCGMTGCNLTREGYVIKITPEQIQEKLDAKFPISKQYLVLFNLTLKDPEVMLKEGSNRIGFGLSATTNVIVNDTDLEGRAHVTAGVHYDPEQGLLSLVDPLVEKLDISLLPDEYHDEAMAAAGIAAKEYLDDYEVYRLDESDFKERLAKLAIKSVMVQDGVLKITLGFGE
jgi:hypothetical protein